MDLGYAWKWKVAVAGWIAVVFFSSTTLAAQWSESAFRFVCSLFLPHMLPHHSAYGRLHFIAEKGVHVTLFLVLATLLWQAFPNRSQKVIAILVTGIVVGCIAEFLQFFFPGRDPAVRDVLIDLGGTTIGVLLNVALSKKQSSREDVLVK